MSIKETLEQVREAKIYLLKKQQSVDMSTEAGVKNFWVLNNIYIKLPVEDDIKKTLEQEAIPGNALSKQEILSLISQESHETASALDSVLSPLKARLKALEDRHDTGGEHKIHSGPDKAPFFSFHSRVEVKIGSLGWVPAIYLNYVSLSKRHVCRCGDITVFIQNNSNIRPFA